MDFTSQDGRPYYRKAFFPGTVNGAEAGIVAVSPGEPVENLKFFLPPDSPAPGIPLTVRVLGFDGKPVPNAMILAYDDIWENSVTPLNRMRTKGEGCASLRAARITTSKPSRTIPMAHSPARGLKEWMPMAISRRWF